MNEKFLIVFQDNRPAAGCASIGWSLYVTACTRLQSNKIERSRPGAAPAKPRKQGETLQQNQTGTLARHILTQKPKRYKRKYSPCLLDKNYADMPK
jgi:hypothetical protein